MKPAHLLCMACAIATLGAAARVQTHATTTTKKNDVLIVRGCVTGRTLVADPTTGSITPAPLRYDLKGSKELLKALESHNRHTEEITGKLKGDDAGGATRAVDKRWGKNRVYAGRAESNRETEQIASGPTIEVTAFTHVSDHCGS